MPDKKFEAKLYWMIRWNYDESIQGKDCKINRVRSVLYLSHAYPRLADGLSLDAEDKALFDQYLENLTAEQNLHEQNAIAVADAIPQEIAELPYFGDCITLRRLAQERVYQIQNRLKSVNRETPEDYFIKDLNKSFKDNFTLNE